MQAQYDYRPSTFLYFYLLIQCTRIAPLLSSVKESGQASRSSIRSAVYSEPMNAIFLQQRYYKYINSHTRAIYFLEANNHESHYWPTLVLPGTKQLYNDYRNDVKPLIQ